MNIKDFKFNNEYHVVTYTAEFPYNSIPITVTANGYTDLSVDDVDEDEDIVKSLIRLNKELEMLLYFQEDE